MKEANLLETAPVATAAEAPDVAQWHGVNLLGMFKPPWETDDPRFRGHFTDEEFGWLGGWGFNFARLPMDYRHFMDSDRTDVDYEEFHGHRLDRRMLELLQKYATPQANVLLTPARRPCYLWHHESAPACGFRRTGVRTAWKAVSVA